MPSSTSNSSAGSRAKSLPWGGVVGVAFVLLLDVVFFRVIAPWEALTARVPYQSRPHHQVSFARGELAALAAAPERSSAVVMGSSRADAGFTPELARRWMPEVAWAQMAYAALRPFEIRSLVDDVIEAGADVVVLAISEYDTHRPLRLAPMPGTAADNVSALVDLMVLGGRAFAWENRTLFYQIPLSGAFDTYRFREILGRAGLNRIHTFPLDEIRHARPSRYQPPRPALAGPWRPPDTEKIQAVMKHFPPESGGFARLQMSMLSEVGPGPQVALQEELLRRAARRLHDAGVRIVIVETPLHPDAAAFYDAGLRQRFLDLVRSLQQESDAKLVPLEAMGELSRDDFGDMLHLNRQGARRFTQVIVEAVRTRLAEGASND